MSRSRRGLSGKFREFRSPGKAFVRKGAWLSVRKSATIRGMRVGRDQEGRWSLEPSDDERRLQPSHIEASVRYLTTLDAIFIQAQDRSEFDFIHTLLGFRGLQSAGWAPYETTLQTIESAITLHNEIEDENAARHLKLWIYGHIMEASEPYEIIGNLLEVSQGQAYRIDFFEQRKRKGPPLSPGAKIEKIAELGKAYGFPDAAVPVEEPWDREFRNAIFHADYALFGLEVRLPEANRSLSAEEVERLIGRATAYHSAVKHLREVYLASYTEPKVIPAGVSFAPGEDAVVIVREGKGAVGMKDTHSRAEIEAGAIPWRMAIVRPGDQELLDADPERARLPADPTDE